MCCLTASFHSVAFDLQKAHLLISCHTNRGEKKVERKRRTDEDCDMSLPLSSGHIFKSLSGKVNWHKGTFVPETVAKLQFYWTQNHAC